MFGLNHLSVTLYMHSEIQFSQSHCEEGSEENVNIRRHFDDFLQSEVFLLVLVVPRLVQICRLSCFFSLHILSDSLSHH